MCSDCSRPAVLSLAHDTRFRPWHKLSPALSPLAWGMPLPQTGRRRS